MEFLSGALITLPSATTYLPLESFAWHCKSRRAATALDGVREDTLHFEQVHVVIMLFELHLEANF